MGQTEKRNALIKYLLAESNLTVTVPSGEYFQRRLLRALLNVRPPIPASEEFLRLQDSYLQEELRLKGVTDILGLSPVAPDIYLWQGDITTLKCDGIVNAANSQMLGCFCPNHGCIDNAIHTYAGVQLRRECAEIMKVQRKNAATGQAKITSAYNLPCKYVLHVVGPIVRGELNKKHEPELVSCYRSCLALAVENGLKSLAFCCISTGVYGYPKDKACALAVRTVRDWKERTHSDIKIIFNVFTDEDRYFYERELS